jgi:hypothetical protein
VALEETSAVHVLRYIADFWIFGRKPEGAIDQWVDLVNVTALPSVVTAQT